MNFTIKEREKTKCASCVHAFRIKPYSSPNTLTICRMLGTPVGKIEECNAYVTISQTGPPPHMMMDAWLIDVTKSRTGRVIGFSANRPPTSEELQKEAIADLEKVIEQIDDKEEQ